MDSTAGYDFLCFLDAFSGYHQIKMATEDEEKMAFIMPKGCYCYTCMPFGLINAGATFQRAMRVCLRPQMGHNIEAYIDDIMVKTHDKATLVEDLRGTFDNLRKVQLKLNPDKCMFGVPSGKLLGILVSHHGIEANPDKIRAIEDIQAPQKVKNVQRLNGFITALGHFISRLGECALPFFKLLKKKGPIQWTPEAEVALQDLKKYLASPPILVTLKPGEPPPLYVAATTQVVSAVLVVEHEVELGTATHEPNAGGCPTRPTEVPPSPGAEEAVTCKGLPGIPVKRRMVQRPMYFVCIMLRDAQERYPEI
jgi:hypothetical protein